MQTITWKDKLKTTITTYVTKKWKSVFGKMMSMQNNSEGILSRLQKSGNHFGQFEHTSGSPMLQMHLALFLSMSLFSFGFTKQGNKGDNGTHDQHKRSVNGPADEIQTKNNNYDKRSFLPQWKTKWPWAEYQESKGVFFWQTWHKYPALVDKSSPFFIGTSNYRIDQLKSHQKRKACEMHKYKERAITEMKDTPIGKALLKVDENQKKRQCCPFWHSLCHCKNRKAIFWLQVHLRASD